MEGVGATYAVRVHRAGEVLEELGGAAEGGEVVAALAGQQTGVQQAPHVVSLHLGHHDITLGQHVDQHRQEVCQQRHAHSSLQHAPLKTQAIKDNLPLKTQAIKDGQSTCHSKRQRSVNQITVNFPSVLCSYRNYRTKH